MTTPIKRSTEHLGLLTFLRREEARERMADGLAHSERAAQLRRWARWVKRTLDNRRERN